MKELRNYDKVTMKKQKIAYIIGDLGKGGQERQLYYLLKMLDFSKYKVNLYVWEYSENDFYVEKIPPKVNIIGFNSDATKHSKLLRFLISIYFFKPDIIHSYASYLNGVFYYTRFIPVTSIKTIGALRSSFGTIENKLTSRKLKRNFCFGDALHVNSKKSLREVEEYHIKIKEKVNAFYIPNGLDENEFYPKIIKDSGSCLRLLSVGRMVPSKEYYDQLRLIRLLLDEGLQVFHTIVGYGPDEEVIRQEIVRLGLKSFVGIENDSEDVSEFYNKSDLFIQTSSSEGLPNCIMEAMSCGLCCFATNAGDTDVLIANNVNGFVFDIHDVLSFKEKLLEVLGSNRSKENLYKYGKLGQLSIQNNYSLKRNLHKIENMYKVVLNGV